MSDFINADGSTKLTKSQHFNALKNWHQANGSLKGFKQTYGVYVDPVKGPMMARAFTNKQGQQYTYNSMSSRKANDERRAKQESSWKPQLKIALEHFGMEDRYQEYVDIINSGNAAWKTRITELNRGLPKEKQFSRGHITAMNAGGLDVPENIMIENRSENSARHDTDEAPFINRRMAGSPQSMEEWVIKQQIPSLDPTRNLPTGIQEQILAAPNTNAIDDILTRHHGSIHLNVNAIMTRANMPALGGFKDAEIGPYQTPQRAEQPAQTPPQETYTPPEQKLEPKRDLTQQVYEISQAVVENAVPTAIAAGGAALSFLGGAAKFITGGGF